MGALQAAPAWERGPLIRVHRSHKSHPRRRHRASRSSDAIAALTRQDPRNHIRRAMLISRVYSKFARQSLPSRFSSTVGFVDVVQKARFCFIFLRKPTNSMVASIARFFKCNQMQSNAFDYSLLVRFSFVQSSFAKSRVRNISGYELQRRHRIPPRILAIVISRWADRATWHLPRLYFTFSPVQGKLRIY